jgi:acyl-CoA thioesterase I
MKLTALGLGSVWMAALTRGLAAPTPAKAGNYLADVVAELQDQWPTNRTVNIVCHGHSVPASYFNTPVVDSLVAYPHLLLQGLKARFPYAVINVIIAARGGEDSESGAKCFERDVLPLRPDVVTIDYALNGRGLGLNRAEAAWRSMVTNALVRHIKVILLTPTPDLTSPLNDPDAALNQHAKQIRRLAAGARRWVGGQPGGVPCRGRDGCPLGGPDGPEQSSEPARARACGR